MDFKDVIFQLADRIVKLKDSIQTEEATKNAFIMPMIQSLGYDVFNPLEVVPEYTCDIGTKKGEKVDYGVMKDGNPMILIECKHWAQDLNLHDNQLVRYFNVSATKFGVLTNGIVYRFYTDLKEPNKMDDKPFLEIDLLDVKDHQIQELKKFHKSYFDLDSIFNTANDLKYTNELKGKIHEELNNPSAEFVKYFVKSVYDGVATQKVLDQFAPLVKKSISTYINDLITDKIKGVLNSDKKEEVSIDVNNEVSTVAPESGIVTTDEELEGFMIVKAILREVVDVSRVVYRDALSYFAILFDDNNRKPICRLYFNGNKKYITTFDENKKETRFDISSLNDLYNCSNELKEVVKWYMNQ